MLKTAKLFPGCTSGAKDEFFVSLIEGRVNETEYEKFLSAYQIPLEDPIIAAWYFILQSTMCRKE